jgi:hypothetical protein
MTVLKVTKKKLPSNISDDDWYLGCHPTWTRMTQEEVRYDLAHHLEDFREPWRAPHGVDSYICKNDKLR